MSPFLNLIPLFLIALPASAQSNNSSYNNCPSYMCGDVNITYPFYKIGTESTSQFCGYQNFGINCSNISAQSIPEITIGRDLYYVRRINYSSKIIMLADYDVSPVNTVRGNCPRVRHNISLGILPLDYPTSTVNLSFHFNCNGSPSSAIGLPCLENIEGNSYVSVINNNMEESEWDAYSCSGKVITTVLNSSLDWFFSNLATEFGRVLEDGFELEWGRTDHCEQCEESDGRCGGGSGGTGFLCFCPGGTISNTYCKAGIVECVNGDAIATSHSISSSLRLLLFILFNSANCLIIEF